jgi:hypothetical protein
MSTDGFTEVLAAACGRREIVATREAPEGGWSVTGQPETPRGTGRAFLGVAPPSMVAFRAICCIHCSFG